MPWKASARHLIYYISLVFLVLYSLSPLHTGIVFESLILPFAYLQPGTAGSVLAGDKLKPCIIFEVNNSLIGTREPPLEIPPSPSHLL